jgi:hypothetical protein
MKKNKLTLQEEHKLMSEISLNGNMSQEERNYIVQQYDIKLLDELEKFEPQSKYSFNVRNSYDAMKYEILKRAYNEMTLDELILKFK